VITFPVLVVVTQDAFTSHDQSQAVLVRVIRTFDRLGEPNDTSFNECDFVNPLPGRPLIFTHVIKYAYNIRRWQAGLHPGNAFSF